MEIYYKHKETGYVVSHTTLKENFRLELKFHKSDKVVNFGDEIPFEDRLKIKKYMAFEIPFSDDFEIIIKTNDEFTIDELDDILSCICYSSNDYELMGKVQKVIDDRIKKGEHND